jgi:hypothetical protein
VLQLGLEEAEVASLSALFQVWLDGFMPPTVELPFTPMGKGMAARCARRAAAAHTAQRWFHLARAGRRSACAAAF